MASTCGHDGRDLLGAPRKHHRIRRVGIVVAFATTMVIPHRLRDRQPVA
jgi:hypothetical protein